MPVSGSTAVTRHACRGQPSLRSSRPKRSPGTVPSLNDSLSDGFGSDTSRNPMMVPLGLRSGTSKLWSAKAGGRFRSVITISTVARAEAVPSLAR